jgi:hypothetical protein
LKLIASSLLILHATLRRFIQSCAEARCIRIVSSTAPRNIKFWNVVRNRHEQLRRQHQGREWKQHLVLLAGYVEDATKSIWENYRASPGTGYAISAQ